MGALKSASQNSSGRLRIHQACMRNSRKRTMEMVSDGVTKNGLM